MLYINSILSIERRISAICLMVIATSLQPGNALSQTNAHSSEPDSMHFRHLSINEGLSQSSIHTLLQDSQGFMWFGTEDGLNKYDGKKFTVYLHEPNNSNSLSDNIVHRLFEDSSGILWIGTNSALSRYDPSLESFQHFKATWNNTDDKQENPVFSILQDETGLLWLGTGMGLASFNTHTNEFKFYNNVESSNNTKVHVTALYIDTQKNFWLATDDGLARFDRNTSSYTYFRHNPQRPDSISSNEITALYEDKTGNLWIGTEAGLNILNRENHKFVRLMHNTQSSQSLSDDHVNAIHEDADGNLWIATADGLNKLIRGTLSFKRITYNPHDPHGLSSNTLISLYTDKSHLLWVGTRGSGLNIFDPKKNIFSNYYHRPGNPASLTGRGVRAVIEDRANHLWVGSNSGLDKFDQARQQVIARYTHLDGNTNSLLGKMVRSIQEDSAGNIWIGTPKGLSKLNPKTQQLTHYQHQPNNRNSMANNYIRVIHEDKQKQLWIGTNKGLSRYNRDNNTFTSYPYNTQNHFGLIGESVRCIFEDSKNRLWIGTNGGLNQYLPESNRFTQYAPSSGNTNTPSDTTILSIDEDQQGMLWLGTSNGLNNFNPETAVFKHFFESDGLPSNTVYSVLVDHKNAVWSATTKGLGMLDQSNMRFTNYTKSDGLQDNEFNANAHYKNQKSKKLYFGGVNGLTTVSLDQIKTNTHIPQVQITSFNISSVQALVKTSATADQLAESNFSLEQSIVYTKNIILPYIYDDISFEFAAMDFSAPSKNQYAYQLAGYDKDWIYSGNNTAATYNNIDPGVYTFKVKGSNNDGIWNEQAQEIQITVTAAWWDTLWFGISSLLILISIVLMGVKWRIRAIEIYNRSLETKVEERTFELQQAQQQLLSHAHQVGMAEMASSVLHNIGNVLNSVNISSDMLAKKIQLLKIDGLRKTSELLVEHFLTCDPNGKNHAKTSMIPGYLLRMAAQLESDRKNLSAETESIRKYMTHIKSIISMQQSTAKTAGAYSFERPDLLLDEALLMNATKVNNNNVRILKEYEFRETFMIDKHKALMIVVNLISNAVDAVQSNAENQRIITLRTVAMKKNKLSMQVIDNGIGISDEILKRMFAHGYTTKKSGHGFGLHSSLLAATQLDGSLDISSAGVGKGATFTLSLPLDAKHRT